MIMVLSIIPICPSVTICMDKPYDLELVVNVMPKLENCFFFIDIQDTLMYFFFYQ